MYQLSIPFVFDDDDECEWQQNTEPEIEWTGDEIIHLCDRLLEDSIRTFISHKSLEAAIAPFYRKRFFHYRARQLYIRNVYSFCLKIEGGYHALCESV